jgi:BirA family biotin operon repressor/biotin-[acetyl-CoA-carboxylase] ligase
MNRYPPGKKRQKKGQSRLASKSKTVDANSYLLQMLLQSAPFYVSGSLLAEKLSMTRVGVWSRIDKLRQLGISIEASQNRGYRIAGEPNLFNLPLLEAWMRTVGSDCKSIVHDQIDSTNSEAERRLADGEDTPFAVVANQQRIGRGRRGKAWHSPKGGNIYLSIGFSPNVTMIRLQTFTLWLGLKIAKFLRDFSGSNQILVKWPNDLLIGGKKLGGMLTEASIDCEHVKSLIFGLGINVNASTLSYPQSIRSQSISLENHTQQTFRLHEITAGLIKVILEGYSECLEGIESTKLTQEWSKYDALKGKKVQVTSGNETFHGVAKGIDASGSLRLKTRNSKVKIIHAGDVTLNES